MGDELDVDRWPCGDLHVLQSDERVDLESYEGKHGIFYDGDSCDFTVLLVVMQSCFISDVTHWWNIINSSR